MAVRICIVSILTMMLFIIVKIISIVLQKCINKLSASYTANLMMMNFKYDA